MLWRRYVGPALNVLLWCLALAVLVQNVVLLRQNRQLRTLVRYPEIEVGTKLHGLSAAALDGTRASIPFPLRPGGRLLVVTLSPGCPICQANKDSFVRLTAVLRSQMGWRVVWISRDSIQSTRAYCEQNGLVLSDVYADPTYDTYNQLGLKSVPYVIAIRADGSVERVWRGRIDTAQQASMSAYFRIAVDDPSRLFP
jgi:peroxiredoxin